MSTAIPERPTVLDATVLSNFAYLNAVSRLQILSRPVVVPAVRTEIEAGVETYPFLANASTALSDAIPVVAINADSRTLRDALADRLDPEKQSPSPSPNYTTGSSLPMMAPREHWLGTAASD